MSKYFILTYGCQMNLHESEKIAGLLENAGYTEAADKSAADLIVLNTCCIRETAEKKILGHLGQLKRLKLKKPALKIALCGCMTQQNGKAGDVVKKYPFIDVVLGTHNLHLLAQKLSEIKTKKPVVEITESYEISEGLAVKRNSMPNAWVNIVYGCDNFCTYCIVPFVRGRERSRPFNAVVGEVRELVAQGYGEITLLGQNVNSYGKNLNDGSSFASLLNALGKIDGKFRLRFMTSHPKDFSDEVIEAIAQNEKICKHIHLPVQAGSSKILKAMNRKYTREDYLALVDKIKKRIPNAKITTDIMVGFNGETESDFLQTLDLVEKCRFSNAFCFVFSKRKGTAAENGPDEVPLEVKTDRIKRLIALQNRITREISKEYIGGEYEILVDRKNDKLQNTYCGRTDCGRLVSFESETDLTGKFVTVKITKAKSASLFGEVKRG